ncbi:hypothetical protein [Xenorhabdus ishibashii]|uniref:Uncharacterized protein n=1 Tax=Xenorhabdus ishibashii TaxID=1034471 RepID=A0A2D0K9N5_9GAMM|nr:hypothetical protein [Xenorhabdus ishibashii]PHM60093.1 hypothetical protein Xish_03236 [Xenorhabdus ishibashii]PHM61159.1 hypothetical protein Xish_00280 [Xenorhabdus ishibashii]
MNSQKKDFGYIATFIAIPVFAVIITYFFHDKIRYNKDLLNFVANMFSILTGFLLLVISTSGEVATATTNTSEENRYNNERKFKIRFQRYLFLFFIYLVVLCLIFIYYLTLPQGDITKLINTKPEKITIILEPLICFFSIVAFSCSFFIPFKIKKLFEEKIKRQQN